MSQLYVLHTISTNTENLNVVPSKLETFSAQLDVKLTKSKYYCYLCKSYRYNYCILKCCNYIICSNCIDDLYDNYTIDNYSDELFKCTNCSNKIYDINIQN